MKKTRIALVVLVAVVLGGCASDGRFRMFDWFGPAARTNTCAGPTCHLEVKVTKAGSTCEASVDFDELTVRHPDSVRIIWKITGDGEFVNKTGAGDGVDAKGNANFQGRLHSDKIFKYDFVQRNRGRHKYDINTKLGGVACKTYDPFIIN